MLVQAGDDINGAFDDENASKDEQDYGDGRHLALIACDDDLDVEAEQVFDELEVCPEMLDRFQQGLVLGVEIGGKPDDPDVELQES